jgi:hypothetical protein
MDEGRKRVIGIMAAIMASLHMETASDLFGRPQGSTFDLYSQLFSLSPQMGSSCANHGTIFSECFGVHRFTNNRARAV